mmetsp:Transcript_104817/g.313137  ORF Transcript_104817/g.313137 Transcript_104817/m.313137 type:complete len:234 (-) Transcript_104817:146-847(-)
MVGCLLCKDLLQLLLGLLRLHVQLFLQRAQALFVLLQRSCVGILVGFPAGSNLLLESVNLLLVDLHCLLQLLQRMFARRVVRICRLQGLLGVVDSCPVTFQLLMVGALQVLQLLLVVRLTKTTLLLDCRDLLVELLVNDVLGLAEEEVVRVHRLLAFFQAVVRRLAGNAGDHRLCALVDLLRSRLVVDVKTDRRLATLVLHHTGAADVRTHLQPAGCLSRRILNRARLVRLLK